MNDTLDLFSIDSEGSLQEVYEVSNQNAGSTTIHPPESATLVPPPPPQQQQPPSALAKDHQYFETLKSRTGGTRMNKVKKLEVLHRIANDQIAMSFLGFDKNSVDKFKSMNMSTVSEDIARAICQVIEKVESKSASVMEKAPNGVVLLRPSNNMLVKGFFFRNGFHELQLINKLLKSPSLVILMSMIMNNVFLKEQAAKESIDETTIPSLQRVFKTLFGNKDEFHFAPNGRSQKTALKKLEDEDTAILEPSLKYLKETLGSFAETIEAMSTDDAPVVSDEAHDINQQLFSTVVKTIGKLHSFVTNPRILQEDLRNEILVHANDLLKIHVLLEKIEVHGVITKGKYPFTAKKELILARNQRDNWLDNFPSIVSSTLRQGNL